MPESQIQALGIQPAPLQNQAGAVKASFPAQVTVPPNAEQVVSSPPAGMVTQLLVQPNQAVRAGIPLVRIASPEPGQLQLQLIQAAARATLARQAVQREQQLFDEGIIPQPNALGGVEYRPQQAFSYRFSVKPGRATYIGQLNLHLSEHDTQKLSVEDKRERDFAILAKKLPALDAAKVTTEIGQVRP